MFKRIRKNKFTNFSILIEDLLSPFWDLGKVLLGESKILEIFAPEILKDSKEVFNNQEQREETDEIKDKKDAIISQGFNDYVVEITNSIIDKKSLDHRGLDFPILLIFRDPINDSLFYISDSEKDKPEDEKQLDLYVKSRKLISSFLQKTENEDLKNMDKVDTPPLYSNVLDCGKSSIIEMPLISMSYLNTELFGGFESECVDLLWINQKRIRKFYEENFPSSFQNIRVLHNEQYVKGVLVGDYLFPAFPLLKDSLLKHDKIFDYVWLCLKHKVVCDISHEEKKGFYNGKELLQSFMKSCKKDDFTKELSNLQDNLFIAKEDMSEEGQQYFDKMLKIQELDKLETYKFYIDEPQTENKNVFGIYQNVKLDEDYHLKFLFENMGDKLADKKIKSFKKDAVWVFKPKIAQFFISDFYEQLLYSSLEELKKSQAIEDYLKNYFAEYSAGGKCEIDAIVKTKDKIFFVEAKTTLTLNLINKYISKCQKIIRDFDEIKDHIGFLIVGYFSHSELNVLKKTVHHDEIPEGYNEERDGLSNTPYYFEVPIGENLDHKLTCFTELSYSKLESTLKSVFK